MKTWVNTELGETANRGETVEEADLYGRREAYKADVPDDDIADCRSRRRMTAFEVERSWMGEPGKLGHTLPEKFTATF